MRPASSESSLSQHAATLAAAYASHSHTILFYSLLGTIAAAPLLSILGIQNMGLPIALAMNLVASVMVMPSGRARTLLLLLTLAAVAAKLAPTFMVAPHLPAASLAFWSVIALFAAADSVRFAMRARIIGREEVYAALSVYLLAGIFFGVLHWAVDQAAPGSYTASGGGPAPFDLGDAMYFSFVTLATLGYGDLVPHNNVARHLAIVEAVAGQLYLTVMIARLVGSWRPKEDR